jgi:hypothetical protein
MIYLNKILKWLGSGQGMAWATPSHARLSATGRNQRPNWRVAHFQREGGRRGWFQRPAPVGNVCGCGRGTTRKKKACRTVSHGFCSETCSRESFWLHAKRRRAEQLHMDFALKRALGSIFGLVKYGNEKEKM